MLTPQHLEILRAALQYFDEELSPHGIDAIGTYLNPSLSGSVTPQQVQQLRQLLGRCYLRYASYERQTLRLMSDATFESPEQLRRRTEGQGIATLLLIVTDA